LDGTDRYPSTHPGQVPLFDKRGLAPFASSFSSSLLTTSLFPSDLSSRAELLTAPFTVTEDGTSESPLRSQSFFWDYLFSIFADPTPRPISVGPEPLLWYFQATRRCFVWPRLGARNGHQQAPPSPGLSDQLRIAVLSLSPLCGASCCTSERSDRRTLTSFVFRQALSFFAGLRPLGSPSLCPDFCKII